MRMKNLGLSILETCMILVILGLLLAIIIPSFSGPNEQAKLDLTRQNLENLRTAINNYFLSYQTWPNNDLGNLVFYDSSWGVDRSFIRAIPVEAITGRNTVKNGSVDNTGGWVWNTTTHEVHPNLFDDPVDLRKKYSQW